MSLHPKLADEIVTRFGEQLADMPHVTHDALTVSFANGLAVELRFVDAHEYSIRWRWGEAEMRIDTAPRHAELSTYPNHMHDAAGTVRADPLTRPGRPVSDNMRTVLAAVLEDPLLECFAD